MSKRGKIRVSCELILADDGKEIMEALHKVFTERCRSNDVNGTVLIEGESDLFEDCNEGQSPIYEVSFKRLENGEIQVFEVTKL